MIKRLSHCLILILIKIRIDEVKVQIFTDFINYLLTNLSSGDLIVCKQFRFCKTDCPFTLNTFTSFVSQEVS